MADTTWTAWLRISDQVLEVGRGVVSCWRLEVAILDGQRDLGASELWVGREGGELLGSTWRWTRYPYPPEGQMSQISNSLSPESAIPAQHHLPCGSQPEWGRSQGRERHGRLPAPSFHPLLRQDPPAPTKPAPPPPLCPGCPPHWSKGHTRPGMAVLGFSSMESFSFPPSSQKPSVDPETWKDQSGVALFVVCVLS